MQKENDKETSLIMPVTPEFIERRIHLIRGQKVLLDSDLAELYQVPVKRLNEQVKRNINCFPSDFMFKITLNEVVRLKSQFATSNTGRGGRRTEPYAFTELGVAMLSSVLKSDRAVQMNIFIMRAFVKLRELLATHKDLADKIQVLEKEQKEQGKDIAGISIAVSRLIKDNLEAKKRLPSAIGFRV
jgi:ORF6N domain